MKKLALVIFFSLSLVLLVYSVPVASACFSDIECAGGGGGICETETSVVQWKCIDGTCQKQTPIEVECCSDTACTDGEVCNLAVGSNQYTCVKSGDLVDPLAVCSPGDWNCDDEDVRKCNQNGWWEFVRACPEGTVCKFAQSGTVAHCETENIGVSINWLIFATIASLVAGLVISWLLVSKLRK